MAEGRGSTRDALGRRTCAGGSDEDTSAGGAVELTLRLSTGSGAAEEEEEKAAAAAARSMTIFYNGRVCAVDVSELQARAIISMANQDILTEQQRRDHDRRQHQDSSSSSSSASGTTAQSGDGSGHQNPTPVALLRAAHCHASPASPRQGLSEVAPPPPMINHAAAGLSMKRSLQRFLQKRKARAAAVASPYASGRPAGPADETLG